MQTKRRRRKWQIIVNGVNFILFLFQKVVVYDKQLLSFNSIKNHLLVFLYEKLLSCLFLFHKLLKGLRKTIHVIGFFFFKHVKLKYVFRHRSPTKQQCKRRTDKNSVRIKAETAKKNHDVLIQ